MPSALALILTPPAGLPFAELDAVPALRAAFARGPVSNARRGGEAWWFARFGLASDGELPAGALRDPAAGASGWRLCADPVNLRVAGDAVVLDASATAGLDADTAHALTGRLNRHFAQDDLVFEAIGPSEWLLRCPRRLEARTCPGADAHGRSIESLLPEGPDARVLKRVMNEAQMLLFDAPENQAREARGLAPVNGLWLWGGATTRPRVAPVEGLLLASKAAHRRALAEAAGGASCLPTIEAVESARHDGLAWIDLDARGSAPDAWLDEVRAWLDHPASRSSRATVVLRLPGGALTAPLFARDWLARFRRGGVARAVQDAGLADAANAETFS